MQIGSNKPIQIPGIGLPPSNSSQGEGIADTPAGGQAPGRGAAVRQITPAQTAPGVVAHIQSTSDTPETVALPPGLVYSNARKAGADDCDADTARMAEQHRQALERANHAPKGLALGKDGVLVAKTAQTKSEEFVSFAVDTMREYADQQARQGAEANQTDGTPHLIPRNLGEVQKLAARFKLFA